MATPSVVSRSSGVDDTSQTGHSITLPATLDAGDMVAIFVVSAKSETTLAWPGTWTEVDDSAYTSNDVSMSTGYLISDGTEDGTSITVTTSAANKIAYTIYRITGAASLEAGTSATATSTTPDPPDFSPSGGSDDYLWIAFGGTSWGADFTAAPSSYTNLTQATNSGFDDAAVGTAERAVTAASENPGTFTIDATEVNIANTIAVVPSLSSTAILTALAVTNTFPWAIKSYVTLERDNTSPYNDVAWVDTPDHADFDISGDMDLRVRFSVPDFTPTTNVRLHLFERYNGDGFNGATTGEHFILSYDGFDGRVQMSWRDSGGTEITQNSSTTSWQPAANDVLDMRVTLDVDNGASGYDFTTYTRVNSSETLSSDTGWTSRGLRVGGATTSWQASASAVTFYNQSTVTDYGELTVYGAILYNGLNNTGTLIFNPDFTDASQTSDGGGTFVDDASRTWTVRGTAAWSHGWIIGVLKAYNGSTWDTGVLKVYNGATWDVTTPKVAQT